MILNSGNFGVAFGLGVGVVVSSEDMLFVLKDTQISTGIKAPTKVDINNVLIVRVVISEA